MLPPPPPQVHCQFSIRSIDLAVETASNALCPVRIPRQALLLLSSRSVLSDSWWPHGLQHARLPCPSPTPGACSNSCPSSQWCHPTISSSVIPFCCLQSFPVSGYFPMSQVFASVGQSIGASESVFPMNIQDLCLLGLTGLILQSKGLSIPGKLRCWIQEN